MNHNQYKSNSYLKSAFSFNLGVQNSKFYATDQLTFTYSKSVMETLEKKVKICSKLTIKIPERRQ